LLHPEHRFQNSIFRLLPSKGIQFTHRGDPICLSCSHKQVPNLSSAELVYALLQTDTLTMPAHFTSNFQPNPSALQYSTSRGVHMLGLTHWLRCVFGLKQLTLASAQRFLRHLGNMVQVVYSSEWLPFAPNTHLLL
jgi:hypothetical protein